jgi:hypothetical protein
MLRIDDLANAENAGVAQFATYWLSMRADGPLPAWEEIDPAGLGQLLPYVAVLEWQAEDRCVYKIVGQAVVDRAGMDPTGANFFDFLPEPGRSFAMTHGRTIFDHPAGVCAETEEHYDTGRKRRAVSVVLPIAADGHGSNMLLVGSPSAAPPSHLPPKDETRERVSFMSLEPIDIGGGVPALDFSVASSGS